MTHYSSGAAIPVETAMFIIHANRAEPMRNTGNCRHAQWTEPIREISINELVETMSTILSFSDHLTTRSRNLHLNTS